MRQSAIQKVCSPITDKNSNYAGLQYKGFKILHLNIYHLTRKLDELKCTILSNISKIDICGFSETFLTDSIDNSFWSWKDITCIDGIVKVEQGVEL